VASYGTIIRKWAPASVIQHALDAEEKRVRIAAQVVVRAVKTSINRGNRSGKFPSAPGEPPKKVSTRLYGSIHSKVQRERRSVGAIVGSNMAYARRLELGFTGVDRKGRRYRMAARPYLRPALANTRGQVAAILGVGTGVGGGGL
jgi:phage gpG-like protein